MSQTVYSTTDTTVVLDPDGDVIAVRHPIRPGRSYLMLGRPRAARPVGEERAGLELTPVRHVVDADELELSLAEPGGLAVTVRHTFAAGWQTRCVVANEGAEALALDVSWPFVLPANMVGWAVADGADAALFVQPDDGRGPLLLARLRQGSVAAVAHEAIQLPTIELAPGARYVAAWDWGWLSAPSEYARRRPSLHPAATTLFRGESVTLAAGLDVALVAPDGLLVGREQDLLEIGSDEPRQAEIELRSARGVTTVRLRWTPTVTEVLAAAARDQLGRPRGPVGVVALPDLAAAIVVQHALRAELLDDADDAADALDLFTARLDAGQYEAALAGLYLCGEYERTGDRMLLDLARDEVLRAARPESGLGIAASRICAALLAAGGSPAPVLRHLIVLAEESSADVELAASTEIAVITQLTGGGGPRSDPDEGLLASVLALGTALGSGLPGDPIEELDVERLGQLLATFAALPDEVAEPTRQAWGVPAADLAARLVPTLVDRLAGRPVGPGHVWLALLATVE